ncbi:MAG: TfoX/Sxy family protein [Alphaproteobacteria bacterium]
MTLSISGWTSKNRAKSEAEGCEPFLFNGKTRQTTMPYWRAPERLFDDTDEFIGWAEAAIAAAVRNKVAKQPKPKRR